MEWCFLESCAGQRRGDDVGPGEKTAQLGQKEALGILSLSGLCLPGGGSPDRELRGCTAALHSPCRRHAARLLGEGLFSWEKARLDDLGWPGSGTLKSQLGAEWRLGGAALTKKPKDRK